MKKCFIVFLKIFSVCLATISALLNASCKQKSQPSPGNEYIYSREEQQTQELESNWFNQYYLFKADNPYNDFITQKNNFLDYNKASKQAMSVFDNLYDNQSLPKVWNNFSELNFSLTITRLSYDVQLNISWNRLFGQVSNDQGLIRCADQLLLRFYNIIAKLYQRQTAISLVQTVNLQIPRSHPFSDNMMGVSYYSPAFNGVAQKYSIDFINKQKIAASFIDGYSVSSNLIVTIIHEYAHALSWYVLDNDQQRQTFNTFPLTGFQN